MERRVRKTGAVFVVGTRQLVPTTNWSLLFLGTLMSHLPKMRFVVLRSTLLFICVCPNVTKNNTPK